MGCSLPQVRAPSKIAVLLAPWLAGCGADVTATSDAAMDSPSRVDMPDTLWASDVASPLDVPAPDVSRDVALADTPVRDADATVTTDRTVPPADGAATPGDAPPPDAPPPSCEERFWRTWVSRSNAGYADLPSLGHDTFLAVQTRHAALVAQGARVSLGAVLSILVYEGAARVAFYNDRCSENSYVARARCWETPQARYSYQLGMGVIHTSNFYPCRDTVHTSRMRSILARSLATHGFTPTTAQVSSVTTAFNTVCPGMPTAVDYYLLSIHATFGVPVDSAGNDLAHVGRFPLFTPEVSLDVFFGELGASPSALTNDRQAIVVFGGGDPSYRDVALQDRILTYYTDFRAANCGRP